jgi:hypothetical protein
MLSAKAHPLVKVPGIQLNRWESVCWQEERRVSNRQAARAAYLSSLYAE